MRTTTTCSKMTKNNSRGRSQRGSRRKLIREKHSRGRINSRGSQEARTNITKMMAGKTRGEATKKLDTIRETAGAKVERQLESSDRGRTMINQSNR